MFPINAALLQKLKNKIPCHKFLIRAVPPVFDEVKFAFYKSI